MFTWLKKHFIPHEGNEHRPHILRGYNIRNLIIIVIFLEIITFLLPTLTHLNTAGNMAAVLPAVLSNLTNEKRQSQDLQTLTVNPILNKAAEMKAEDMSAKGYFAHTSPEGKTPWYWLEQVGYQYQYAGENLAINFSDSKDVATAWMSSSSHKSNIIKENYTEIGTGIATGIYEGYETIFVTQIYANPLKETIGQIESTSKEIKTNNEELINVLGAETVITTENTQDILISPAENASFWQKLIASPRNTTNIFLYIIFGIIVLALFLYVIFIKMKNHHLGLITNGLVVLAIIGVIFITNYYLSHHNMVITQSLDF
ncbi:CAP domain-containing protein [Patescibacteria group bacterium]|nr:CAP domain-containing protein [Patescibacteria group bacterium]